MVYWAAQSNYQTCFINYATTQRNNALNNCLMMKYAFMCKIVFKYWNESLRQEWIKFHFRTAVEHVRDSKRVYNFSKHVVKHETIVLFLQLCCKQKQDFIVSDRVIIKVFRRYTFTFKTECLLQQLQSIAFNLWYFYWLFEKLLLSITH